MWPAFPEIFLGNTILSFPQCGSDIHFLCHWYRSDTHFPRYTISWVLEHAKSTDKTPDDMPVAWYFLRRELADAVISLFDRPFVGSFPSSAHIDRTVDPHCTGALVCTVTYWWLTETVVPSWRASARPRRGRAERGYPGVPRGWGGFS